MKNWNLLTTNPTWVRVIYVLLALLAMALAGGAPDGFGGFSG